MNTASGTDSRPEGLSPQDEDIRVLPGLQASDPVGDPGDPGGVDGHGSESRVLGHSVTAGERRDLQGIAPRQAGGGPLPEPFLGAERQEDPGPGENGRVGRC